LQVEDNFVFLYILKFGGSQIYKEMHINIIKLGSKIKNRFLKIK